LLSFSEHQQDPGARADAADPDHLARCVHVAEALEQAPPIVLKCASVAASRAARELLERLRLLGARELLERHDQHWVVGDPRLTVDDRGQLLERPHAVLRPGLGEVSLHQLPALSAGAVLELANDHLFIEPRVPQLKRLHRRIALHRVAIRARHRQVDLAPFA
jgi:hypothetical protein